MFHLQRKRVFLWGVALIIIIGVTILVGKPLAVLPGAPQPGPVPQMMGPFGNLDVPFTTDPEDNWMTQPQWGPPVVPVSLDVDLRTLPQIGPVEKDVHFEFERADLEIPSPDFVDPVLQPAFATGVIPSPSANFAGLDLNNWGAGWPPDTNGDIGPTYYIQTVNTSIGIYNRSGVQQAAFTFDTFFSGTSSPCDSANNGDPVVLYDDVSGRWIITDFAWTNTRDGPYYECIAVSKTADPVSGGWWLYALVAHNSYLNDYPKLGVWHDGIYMTANMFDCLNTTCSWASYKGVRFWAINRDDLIAGNPLNYQYGDLGTAYFSLLPSHARGSSMPAPGTPNYLGSIQNSTTFYTWKLTIDWNNAANSTLTGPFATTVAAWSNAADVPQPAGPNLDSLSGRLMMQLQYSEASGQGALWVTHSVSTSGRAGIRWYELRNLSGTPSVFQQGTYSPDALHRWMGSVGVDKDGNMAVVYSVSDSSTHPQIRYAGRLAGDAAGTLGQGEATLIAGTGSQTTYNRWGDYASMSIDPLDECTFWFTTEYLTATGTNWQTRIGAFKFPTCNPPTPTPTPTATPLPSASLNFVPGWNLITLPLDPPTPYTAQTFLADVNGQGGTCTEVHRWTSLGWEGFVSGFAFNNFTLEMGVGYFVKCSSTSSMSYSGAAPTTGVGVSLVPGWNLIGVPYSSAPYTAQALLDDVNTQGGTCTEVDRWWNGGWDGFVDGYGFNNYSIEGDRGYFLRCTSSSSFTPTSQQTSIAPLILALGGVLPFIGALVWRRRPLER